MMGVTGSGQVDIWLLLAGVGKEGEIFLFREGGASKLFPRGSHTGFVCPQVLF